MAPWAPLERSAWEEATLEEGGEGAEAAGQPPLPPSALSPSAPPLPHSLPHEDPRTHTKEGRVCLLVCAAQGDDCLWERVWAGCPGQVCNRCR